MLAGSYANYVFRPQMRVEDMCVAADVDVVALQSVPAFWPIPFAFAKSIGSADGVWGCVSAVCRMRDE